MVGISFDETISSEHLARIGQIFGVNIATPAREVAITRPRKSSYLTHPIFSTTRSETSMMRNLRTLADRDLALDLTMIPLGSCTMKLNAATEMEAVTWPEFS